MSDKSHNTKEEKVYQGIAASPGIAHGQLFVYITPEVDVPQYSVGEHAHNGEVARFEQSLLETRKQINGIRNEVAEKLGEEEARIFDAHLLVLEDAALIDETIRNQQDSGDNIEFCFYTISQRYIEAFKAMDDDYIKERANDIKDVAKRLLNVMLGNSPQNISQLSDSRIVVAEDLPPSDTATIDKNRVQAVAIDYGSRTSHAVIMARSLRVPAVVGLHDITSKVTPEDYVLVDGYAGKVFVNPTEDTLFSYGQMQKAKEDIHKVFVSSIDKQSQTTDGHKIKLLANIGNLEDARNAIKSGAEGIGLFRTESIFLSRRDLPDEEEQYRVYSDLIDLMSPQEITVRTLDLGGDKLINSQSNVRPEVNPFMGLRGIRFCMEHRNIFKQQLRALLRASLAGKFRIMYPMISSLKELHAANAVLEECRNELEFEGTAYGELEVGVMIEVPSAAFIADQLAQHCSFFSIGTNDLIQYLLAIDRLNDQIADLYQPTHPAVLRSIQTIIECGMRHGIDVGVCGEMAGDPIYMPLLIGLGATKLSMNAAALPEMKYLLTSSKYTDMRRLTFDMLEESSGEIIHQHLEDIYSARVKEIV